MPKRPPKPTHFDLCEEYLQTVRDLLAHPKVQSMGRFMQHRNVDCLHHSLNVSFTGYRICRRLGLDCRAAARGGLLHDFFLYDWHKGNPHKGLHGFTHPRVAEDNAARYFSVTKRERDIIRKHMWPLTLAPPRYPESYVILLVDKFYCIAEAFAPSGFKGVRRLIRHARKNGLLSAPLLPVNLD
jgi:uncharacterized protein